MGENKHFINKIIKIMIEYKLKIEKREEYLLFLFYYFKTNITNFLDIPVEER